MIVSVDWLKNFVDIDDDLEVLSETLSNLGLESEVLPIPKKIPGVKIAKVEKIVKHPNADKLQLCDIYDGVKINKVICGAPNIEAGQIVAFAMVGSTLPGDLKIKKSNIRGIDSFGMVCSEKELNLSEEHDGIMVLPQELTVGEDFDLAYGYKFVAINIDITPNRPDALCYLGVARDISCFKNIALNKIKINKIKPKLSKNIQVSIEDFSDCPRYIAGVINNIKVEKSPDWIIERLKSSGLRSINNVVDISNIVMLEMGHPSHIFDFESIDTNNIYVRRAKKSESIKVLDGVKYNLTKDNLLITDGQNPIALAGVMGGIDSSIKSKTKCVMVECAYFDPITIRKSSKISGLSTDASKRFERGVDPNACEYAFWRIVNLLQEYAGGVLASEMFDKYPNVISNKRIELEINEIINVLGVAIPNEKIEAILHRLDFKLKKYKNGYICSVPTFRPDITRQIDIIEEIARIYGYNLIPAKNSLNGNYRFTHPDPEKNYDLLRKYCSGLGFQQIYSNSLQNKSDSNRSGIKPVKMLNPLNIDMGYLRTELITGLIKASVFNIKHGSSNFRLFDLSNVHECRGELLDDILESKHLAAVIYGKNVTNSVHDLILDEDFFVLKGVLSFLFEKKFKTNLKLIPSKHPLFISSYSININGKNAGHVGQIRLQNSKNINTKIDKLNGFYIDLELIKDMLNTRRVYKKINLLPELHRDLNLVIHDKQNTGDLVNLIFKNGRKLVKTVKPVNIFTDEKSIGNALKSVTFHIVFQHKTKTLQDKDVNPIIEKIINVAENDFGAKLRV